MVAGDAATDFLGSDANNWEQLKDIVDEEEIPHRVVAVPPPKA